MPNPSKFHQNLVEALQSPAIQALGAADKIPIIVKWRSNRTGANAVPRGISAPRYTYTLIPGTAHQSTRAEINALSDLPDVELIWHDSPVHILLDESVPLIGAPRLWQQGITGVGIKVAIVDTGIDTTHPDLVGRVIAFKDFMNEGPKDYHGHGTHVAGIVGGTGTASQGRFKGIASDCLFIAAKVLGFNGYGESSGVIAGIEWAVQQGAQVINLSLGSSGPCDGTDAESVACDAAVQAGTVMCVAAGNSGPDSNTIASPACARLVITVGATDKSDQIAEFSSRGPTLDGRVKPDLCFPGVNITSCRADSTYLGNQVNQFYTSASGTSMATPHATGSVALLLQQNPGLTPQQVKDALTGTAKNLGLDANTQGSGRGDVFAASETRQLRDVSFSPAMLNPGDLMTVQFTVYNGSSTPLATQGPEPGFVYEEGDTFYSRGFPDQAGAFRLGVDFDARVGIDHPYRWGLGTPLAPGETRTVTGYIRIKYPQRRYYWAGFVQERVSWFQDRRGIQLISVMGPQPVPAGSVTITDTTIVPTTLAAGNYLVVVMHVRNNGAITLLTQAPDPGFIYEESDSFDSRGFGAQTGSFRVGIDFDGRAGIDHPYRWGLGKPLGPGETALVTGAIHLRTPGTKKYWTGLVQEYVQWMQDQQGTQTVTVKPGPVITSVTFTPTTLAVGQVVTVSITVRNNGDIPLQTQGPDPTFAYEEGDTFVTRGFADTQGAFRVGVDFDQRAGIDHPYRWGLGAPLAPGQATTITGTIRLKIARTQGYWAGLVQERVAWAVDRQGTQVVTVS